MVKFDIVFIWINKHMRPISDDVKSRIEMSILKWNQYKTDNYNIRLYLDFKYTHEEDIEYFRGKEFFGERRLFYLEDVRKLNVIESSPELQRLYQDDIPIYMRVDITKILTEYELLEKSDKSEPFYVVSCDIDLMDETDDLPKDKANCPSTNTLPTFTEENLFDGDTLKLLDLFGIVMSETTYPPENNFMIVKNDKDVINALHLLSIQKFIKEFMYNIFENEVNVFSYNSNARTLNSLSVIYNLCLHFIYRTYQAIINYINIAKGYLILKSTSIHNSKLETRYPYNIKKIDHERYEMIIDSVETFWTINDNSDDDEMYNKFFVNYSVSDSDPNPPTISFSTFHNCHHILTKLGQKIYDDNKKNIFKSGSYLNPTKCVMLEKTSTNSINIREFCPQFYTDKAISIKTERSKLSYRRKDAIPGNVLLKPIDFPYLVPSDIKLYLNSLISHRNYNEIYKEINDFLIFITNRPEENVMEELYYPEGPIVEVLELYHLINGRKNIIYIESHTKTDYPFNIPNDVASYLNSFRLSTKYSDFHREFMDYLNFIVDNPEEDVINALYSPDTPSDAILELHYLINGRKIESRKLNV